jgi:Ca2+-binding EF-hand superfamily protein
VAGAPAARARRVPRMTATMQDIEFKDMKNLMINVLYFVKLYKVFAKMDLDNDGRIKLHDFTQVISRRSLVTASTAILHKMHASLDSFWASQSKSHPMHTH